MVASDCAHPHPRIVCWRLSHNSDSLSVAKSQLFLPAIARNSSRIARCAGVIPSLARMASIPSLIPRNAPSTATPFPGFHMNRTLDSCVPTIRFLKSIVIFPSRGSAFTSLSHLCQTALGDGMAALSPFIHKNRGLITLRFLARTCARYFHASGRNRCNPAAEHSTQANDRPGKNHRSLSDCGRLRSLAAEKKFQDTRAICLPCSLGGMLCLFVGNPTDRNSYAGVSPLACFQIADVSRAGSRC
jgi:hypothetical protein